MAVSTDPNDPYFGLETDPASPNFGLSAEGPPTPEGPPPFQFLPHSANQMESLAARELLQTPESIAAGDLRGLGDEPVVQIPRIPQQESLPEREGLEVPFGFPRSPAQEESLAARIVAQDLPQTSAAAVNVGEGLIESALTPQNLAIAPVAPSLPAKIALTGVMGKSAYEGVKQSFDPDLTMQQRGEAGLGGVAAAVFAALTAKHLIGGKVSKPRPTNVPNFTEAGVLPEALHFAGIRGYAPKFVDDLLAKTFPDLYKDPVKMNAVTATIRDDNILGGYDDAVQHLVDLRINNAPAAEIQAQLDVVQKIQNAHNLSALNTKVHAAKGSWQQPYIENWEKHVSPEMDRLYNEWKGYSPTTPQETRGRHFKSRMNLLPDFMEQQMRDWYDHTKESPEGQVTNYRNPDTRRDKFMRKALLTGKYSSDTELVLTNSFAGRLRNVALMKFYQGLVDKGVAEWLDVGDPVPDLVGGKKAVRWEAKIPITSPGGATTMGIRNLALQEHLVPEMKQLVGTDTPFKQNKFSQYVTGLQLYQLADAVAHGKNMHSVLVHSLKGMGFTDEMLRRIPVVASANAVEDVGRVMLQVMKDDPAIRAEKAFLAKYNMLRPEYGGQQSKLSPIKWTSEAIHKADTASRILLNRWFDEMVKNGTAVDTIENRYQFVSRMGEYNRKLMTKNQAALRDIGASPFIVAGKNFNRFSRRLLTGDPGFEATSKGAELAARAKIMSGTLMAGLIPAVINEATTGTPGGRDGTPIGSIDFGAQYDTPDGKRRNLDVFQLMGIRRGLRGTGLNAVIEGVRVGQDPMEIKNQALTDIGSTALHPYTGPAVGFAERLLSGKRFDLRAGKGEPFGPRYIPEAQFEENARVALKEANPPAYSILQPAINKSMQSIFGVPPSSEDVATTAPGGLAKQVLEKISPETMRVPGGQAATRVVDALIKSPLQALGYKETVSPALRLARERSQHFALDPKQDVRFGIRKRIMDMAKRNPAQADVMTSEAQARGILTEADVHAIERREAMPDMLQQAVQRLGPKDALDVFARATFKEKQLIYDQVNGKIERSRTLSDPIKTAYLIKLQQLGGAAIQ